METITSPQNPRIKQIHKLRDKRGRERAQRFVIDETRDLARALRQGYQIDYALYCPELAVGDELALLAGQVVFEVPQTLMIKASYRQNPAPLLAVMKARPLHDISSLTDELVLALVDLRKPGNIGALLRTADAAGFRAVVLVDTALDRYNPNIIRSSTGACFLDNIYSATTAQAIEYFRTNHYAIIAAAVDGDRSLFDADFRQKSVVVLGTEDQGLDDIWLQKADQCVQIPMAGHLSDSLNVSVSGAVFMYEALRQHEN